MKARVDDNDFELRKPCRKPYSRVKVAMKLNKSSHTYPLNLFRYLKYCLVEGEVKQMNSREQQLGIHIDIQNFKERYVNLFKQHSNVFA